MTRIPVAERAKTEERRTILDARGLSVALPNGALIVEALDLTLVAGEVVTLLGPSGVGKTTLRAPRRPGSPLTSCR